MPKPSATYLEGTLPSRTEIPSVKWKNIDIGAAYYYITSTLTEWMPLFKYPSVRAIVCEEISRATAECGGHISAYVIMPDHLHLLGYLPNGNLLHKYCKLWRGRSARRITIAAEANDFRDVLFRMARHASGGARYAVWKEQVRSLPMYNESKLLEKIAYIHANPVRRGLVQHPDDWEYSSWRFYEEGVEGAIRVVPWS